jgi:hypothetical protein
MMAVDFTGYSTFFSESNSTPSFFPVVLVSLRSELCGARSAQYVFEVCELLLTEVRYKTITFTICAAANFAMLGVSNSTPPGLVVNHALRLIIGLVWKTPIIDDHEVLSFKLFTVERVEACTRIMMAVDFPGYSTFICDCDSTPGFST